MQSVTLPRKAFRTSTTSHSQRFCEGGEANQKLIFLWTNDGLLPELPPPSGRARLDTGKLAVLCLDRCSTLDHVLVFGAGTLSFSRAGMLGLSRAPGIEFFNGSWTKFLVCQGLLDQGSWTS